MNLDESRRLKLDDGHETTLATSKRRAKTRRATPPCAKLDANASDETSDVVVGRARSGSPSIPATP
jgi:hypothetical protein